MKHLKTREVPSNEASKDLQNEKTEVCTLRCQFRGLNFDLYFGKGSR